MAKAKLNRPPEDEDPGAPEWMVTFSDCMTLLLTFFVLLLTFSSFDDKDFRQMETSLAKALPSVGTATKRDRDSFETRRQIRPNKEIHKGSEKPTLKKGKAQNIKEDLTFLDFQNRKVFIVSSDKVFLGKGSHMTFMGREVFTNMAILLKSNTNRIVISETGSTQSNASVTLGLRRATAVMAYLTKKKGLDPDRFSISAASTLPEKNIAQTNTSRNSKKDKRRLEIIVLERSIYK